MATVLVPNHHLLRIVICNESFFVPNRHLYLLVICTVHRWKKADYRGRMCLCWFPSLLVWCKHCISVLLAQLSSYFAVWKDANTPHLCEIPVIDEAICNASVKVAKVVWVHQIWFWYWWCRICRSCCWNCCLYAIERFDCNL